MIDLVEECDENIKGWHSGLFGKQVQQSILGGIISELKKLPQTSIVDRLVDFIQTHPFPRNSSQFHK